jgi:hypothetical protein
LRASELKPFQIVREDHREGQDTIAERVPDRLDDLELLSGRSDAQPTVPLNCREDHLAIISRRSLVGPSVRPDLPSIRHAVL